MHKQFLCQIMQSFKHGFLLYNTLDVYTKKFSININAVKQWKNTLLCCNSNRTTSAHIKYAFKNITIKTVLINSFLGSIIDNIESFFYVYKNTFFILKAKNRCLAQYFLVRTKAEVWE